MSRANRRPALTASRVRDLRVLADATRVKPRSNAGMLFETNPLQRAAMRRAKEFIRHLADWHETEREIAEAAERAEPSDPNPAEPSATSALNPEVAP